MRHIASLVNPPRNPKASYYSGPEPRPDPELWLAAASQRTGSWWEAWVEWMSARSGETISAPDSLGSRKHRPLGDAPGTYVMERIA